MAILRIAAILFPACAAAPAFAGQMGATSRATATITLSVAPHLEVRSAAGANPASGPGASREYGFCVSANTPTGAYGVSFEPGAGASGRDGAAAIAVEWAGVPIPAGAPVGGFVASARPCSARRSATATLILRRPAGTTSPGAVSPATLLIVPE
jgi:hypothetical protein